MATSPGFRDYVVEQLEGVRDLTVKRMFGGLGCYSGETFFALVIQDTLYLKVGDANRAMFEEAGSAPFRPYEDQAMTMRYWNVPLGVLEDADELTRWANAAIAMARAEAAAARPAKRPPVGRKGTRKKSPRR